MCACCAASMRRTPTARHGCHAAAPVDVLEAGEGEQRLRLLLGHRRHGPAAEEGVDGTLDLVLAVHLPPVAGHPTVVVARGGSASGGGSASTAGATQRDAAPRDAAHATVGEGGVLNHQVVRKVRDNGAVGHAVDARRGVPSERGEDQ